LEGAKIQGSLGGRWTHYHHDKVIRSAQLPQVPQLDEMDKQLIERNKTVT